MDLVKNELAVDQQIQTELQNKSCTESLRDMIIRVESEPKRKMIYSGIKENSVGFVFGPAKSGKTILCENLGFSIAAGLDSYLGRPIEIENRKVLFISLEEFYPDRTERNEKQTNKLVEEMGFEWINNYRVVNENMPRYISLVEDREMLHTIFQEEKPGTVFIDSLSRLYSGSIEDSATAKELMRKLRELANSTKTTIVIIHHTPKMHDSTPLTIASLAGSRMIGQEADFAIGINKTMNNTRYLKDVAFRYASDNKETVDVIKLTDELWFEKIEEVQEGKLLACSDGRRNDANRNRVLDFIISKSEINNGIVKTSDINEGIDGISKQAIAEILKSLATDGKINKVFHGEYKAVL
ncbi:MAG: AAA family ATPase [Chitinophagaceae bacterium]|nr:AAA family ATPase [Chitinophagaceae bacterium]